VPVFTSGQGLAPDWCEMSYFEIVTLAPGERRRFECVSPKEKVIVCLGQCRLGTEGDRTVAHAGGNLDRPQTADHWQVDEVTEDTVLVRMCGRWGEVTGACGLFSVQESPAPHDRGDPVPYPKTTNFDSHYHDCDEFWIIWEGRGLAVSEGQFYDVGRGDCIATGMGHHHDFARVHEPVRAVYFETTLERAKRLGHLWEHTHGSARPHPDRI
jgi:mannose-6-phosphate isomerase-like protein (cupin superfamily)